MTDETNIFLAFWKLVASVMQFALAIIFGIPLVLLAILAACKIPGCGWLYDKFHMVYALVCINK